MHGRILKPSWKHNAALNAVHIDDHTQKLLVHAHEKDPQALSIDDSLASLVSIDTSDVVALDCINLVGSILIPHLINQVFYQKTPIARTSNAKVGLYRILHLQITITKVDRYETLLRYLINQAYNAESMEARIYALDLLLEICKRNENKAVLGRFPGLIKLSLHLTRSSSQDELKDCAMSIMWVLASKDDNKTLMIEPNMIDFIIEIASDKINGRIRLLTVDTLRLLSESRMHEGFLIAYKGGALITLLQNLIKDDLASSVAVSAFYTISNLITPMTYNHITMINPCFLTSVAVQVAGSSLNAIVHAAAGVVDKLAEVLDATHPEHYKLLCALSIMLDSKTDCGMIMALYSMTTQTQKIINRSPLALCKPLMNALTKILINSKDDVITKPMILEILNQISSEPVSALILMDYEVMIGEIIHLAKLNHDGYSARMNELAVKVTVTMVSHKTVAVELADVYGFRIGFLV